MPSTLLPSRPRYRWCNTDRTHFATYYCSNASVVVQVTRDHGPYAGARSWASQMLQNMDVDTDLLLYLNGEESLTIALRRRREAIQGYLSPPLVSRVLYPFR